MCVFGHCDDESILGFNAKQAEKFQRLPVDENILLIDFDEAISFASIVPKDSRFFEKMTMHRKRFQNAKTINQGCGNSLGKREPN